MKNTSFYSQVTHGFVVLAATVTLVSATIVAAGGFHTDTGYNDLAFGVYESSLKGSPAYYNPGLWTLAVLELASLALMPLVLVVARRFIRILQSTFVAPWTVVAITTVPAAGIWFGSFKDGGALDTSASSILPYFMCMQIPITIGLIVSLSLLVYLIKNSSKGTRSTNPEQTIVI